MAYRGRLSNGTRSGLSGSRRFESCRLTSFVAVGGHRLLASGLTRQFDLGFAIYHLHEAEVTPVCPRMS